MSQFIIKATNGYTIETNSIEMVKKALKTRKVETYPHPVSLGIYENWGPMVLVPLQSITVQDCLYYRGERSGWYEEKAKTRREELKALKEVLREVI